MVRAARIDPGKPAVSSGRAVRRLWQQVRILVGGRFYRLWVLSAVSIIGGFTEAAVLYLVVRIAIALASTNKTVHLSLGPIVDRNLSIGQTLLVAVVAVLFLTLLGLIETVVSARMSADALRSTRKQLFGAFVRASWDVQSREREGRLQDLMTTHVFRVAMSIGVFTSGFIAAFNFIALVASAVLVDPIAAGSSLLGFMAVFLLLRPLNVLSKRASRKNAEANKTFASRITESVSLAREVHVFDVGEQLVDRIENLADDASRTMYVTRVLGGIVSNVYRNITLLMVLLGMAAVYAIGLSEVSQLGAVVLLLVRSLSYSQNIQSSVQAAAELAPYLEDLGEQEVLYLASAERRDGVPLGRVERIELQDVGFSYTPGVPVLRDVTFAVERGEVIGIVGPSGSGKSTLVQILLRLRNAASGAYLVNGGPAGEYDLGDWYHEFVFVPQDNRLIFDTVAANIAFYRPDIPLDAVERAAKLSHLHEEIMQWPDGYETLIGAGGQDLSGGQKQRLALARALVGDQSVLVLDEPTSALDLRSERLVKQTLEDLRGDVTLFIVAHRLSTLSICDRVLVLRNGVVEAFGHHDDLRRSDGFYREALQIMAAAEPHR